MPEPLVRFISRKGPDESDNPDVRFLKSVTSDYEKARIEKDRVQEELNGRDPTHRAVLYRMARKAAKLYLCRQRPDSNGDQRDQDEPGDAKPIGYMIVTTPGDLVRDDQPTDDDALSGAVNAICSNFSQGRPDPAGPH